MNRLTHPTLTYLWWCISGISCSLSECTDWIDVFSTWSFPHNKDKAVLSNSIEKCFYFLVAYWSLTVFTACSLLLRCEAEVNQSELGSGQAPFSHTLLSEKGILVSYSLINIDRWLSWRWTQCDVRSVISGYGAYQWWWIIQSLLLPLNTEYNRVLQNAAETHMLLYKRGKFVVWLMCDSFSFYHRKICRKAHSTNFVNLPKWYIQKPSSVQIVWVLFIHIGCVWFWWMDFWNVFLGKWPCEMFSRAAKQTPETGILWCRWWVDWDTILCLHVWLYVNSPLEKRLSRFFSFVFSASH